jgi:hypothetical protein
MYAGTKYLLGINRTLAGGHPNAYRGIFILNTLKLPLLGQSKTEQHGCLAEAVKDRNGT